MLTKNSIKRPYTIVVLVLIVMIVGAIAIFNMPIDMFPDMDIPVMVVATVAPGQAPEQVEKQVTEPLESRLRQVNNVTSVNSISSQNVSLIIMQFSDKVDLTVATQDIQAKVKEASPSFPDMTVDPVIMKVDLNQQAALNIAITKEGSSLGDSTAQLQEIADSLKAVDGVAGVNTSGGVQNMVALNLDMDHAMASLQTKILSMVINNAPVELTNYIALIGFDPTLPDFGGVGGDISGILGGIADIKKMINPKLIETAIMASDFEMPAGQVSVGGLSYFVNVGKSVEDMSELKNLPLMQLNINDVIPDMQKIDEELNSGKISVEEWQEKKAAAAKYVNYSQVGDSKALFAGKAVVDLLKETLRVNHVPEEKIEAEVDKLFVSKDVAVNGRQFVPNIGNMLIEAENITATMQDIALVHELNNASTQHAVVNGSPAMLMSIMKQPGASTVDVSKGIMSALDNTRKGDPTISYQVLYDQGEDISFMISTIVINLLIGALMAVVILIVFLKDIRPTFAVGVSIFISILAALALMYLCGVTLNLVSMGGLALAVGMLVDNAIVVIENIYRQRKEGASPIKAAFEGAKQVGGAIVASTITTIVVFLPIIFVDGIVKQVFTDLALTITFALLASLVVALTLVPMLASRMLKKEAKTEFAFISKMRDGYVKALNFALNKKWIALLCVTVLLGVSVVGIVFMNKELFPNTILNNFTVGVNVDTQVLDEKYKKSYHESINDIIDEVSNTVRSNENVETVGVELSKGTNMAGVNIGGGQIIAYVQLKDKHKGRPAKIKKAIEEQLRGINYAINGVVKVYDTSEAQMLGDTSVLNINVKGSDFVGMRNSAHEIKDMLNQKGYTNVTNGLEDQPQEYRIEVDRAKASAYGLLPAHVYLAVSEILQEPGSNVGIKFADKEDQTAIWVYGFDYEFKVWRNASLPGGGKDVKVYIEPDNKAEQTSKMYFMEGTEKINVFEFGGGLAYGTDMISPPMLENVSQDMYYGAERETDFDLVTETLRFGTILANPELSQLFTDAQKEVLNKGIELYKLIDHKASCEKDGENVIYRDAEGKIPQALALQAGLSAINRVDGQRTFSIKIKLDKDTNMNKAKLDIQKLVNEYTKADGVIVEYIGEDQTVDMVFDSLFLILGLAIVFIYLVMVAQFQSLKSPFIVMFTIPLAFTGSILLLWACGMQLGIFAMVGLILLMGVVVNNGIVFVDYVNKLMLSGMTKREALLKTGKDRLRPILMTALTTIVALLATVIDPNPSAETIKPMAIATIGGLTYATILTLFIVPIFYDLLNRKNTKKAIVIDGENDGDDLEKEMLQDKLAMIAEVVSVSYDVEIDDDLTLMTDGKRGKRSKVIDGKILDEEDSTNIEDIQADVADAKRKRLRRKASKDKVVADEEIAIDDNTSTQEPAGRIIQENTAKEISQENAVEQAVDMAKNAAVDKISTDDNNAVLEITVAQEDTTAVDGDTVVEKAEDIQPNVVDTKPTKARRKAKKSTANDTAVDVANDTADDDYKDKQYKNKFTDD